MAKVRFAVFAHYPMKVWDEIDHIEWEEKLEKIAKKYGGREYGSGTDFTNRDLHYGNFKNVSSARKFASHLKKFKYIKTVEVEEEPTF